MTRLVRRTLLGLVATTALAAAVTTSSTAQESWPAKGKPVNVIVSAGAGSGQDLTARILTEQLA